MDTTVYFRRPNEQLVDEFKQLMSSDLRCEYAERALPVMLGHLVKMTCLRANLHKQVTHYPPAQCSFKFGELFELKEMFYQANSGYFQNG